MDEAHGTKYLLSPSARPKEAAATPELHASKSVPLEDGELQDKQEGAASQKVLACVEFLYLSIPYNKTYILLEDFKFEILSDGIQFSKHGNTNVKNQQL